MEFHILVLFLVSVGSKMACSTRQYHFVSGRLNWTDAQAFCKEKFTDLATVDSTEDMTRLDQLATDHSHSGEVWIGLYQDVDSWRWSLNQSSFYGEGEMEYRNWGPGEPNNQDANGQECCVDIKKTRWNDDPCQIPLPFICYDAGKPNPYILVSEKLSWRDAQSYCRTNYIDLASVRNARENQLIVAEVSDESTWIGLHRECLLWRWSDKSRSPFRKWSPSYPTGEGNCAALSVGGDWYERNCDHLKSFVCYGEVTQKQIVRVELQMDSQVDMSDPALQAAILQQIEQRLKAQGLPAEAKLRWIEKTDGQIFGKKGERGGGRVVMSFKRVILKMFMAAPPFENETEVHVSGRGFIMP